MMNSISQMLARNYSSVSNVVFFEPSTSVSISVLVVSLQRVLCYLPTPSLVLFHCWMKSLIDSVSEHMIKVALSLTSCPCITATVELVLMVILTLLLSAAKGGLPGLALETVNIQKVLIENLRAACSITNNRVLPCTTLLYYTCRYFLYLQLHFCNN